MAKVNAAIEKKQRSDSKRKHSLFGTVGTLAALGTAIYAGL